MNISPISGLGNLQQTQFKKNISIRLKSSDEEQKDTFQPSFKANFAKAKSASKAILLSSILGLAAFSNACKKTDNNDNLVDNCACESGDFTEISRDFVELIPDEDTIGRKAYLEWFDANIETKVLDPDCCHHILPADPYWETRCMEWIDNYINCNEIGE